MFDLADIWTGCGCLFLLVILIGGLVLVVAGGGQGGLMAVLALIGIGAYFAWANYTNHNG